MFLMARELPWYSTAMQPRMVACYAPPATVRNVQDPEQGPVTPVCERASDEEPEPTRHDAGTGTGAMELPGPMPLQPFWTGSFSNRWVRKA